MKLQTKYHPISYKHVSKSNTLMVLMSGLSGDIDSALFEQVSKEFPLSSLRVDFGQVKSFKVYLSMLKTLLDKLDYPHYVFVGHSFGAVISLLFLKKFKRYCAKSELVLWEQTHLPWKLKGLREDFPQLSNSFVRSLITTDTLKIYKSLEKEACIIASSDSAAKDAKKYGKAFIIKNGGHCFKSKKVRKILFSKTLDFIKTKALMG